MLGEGRGGVGDTVHNPYLGGLYTVPYSTGGLVKTIGGGHVVGCMRP